MNQAVLASLVLGPVQFDRPAWLLLIPALAALTWLIARRSLSGLAGPTRWVALAARLLVIALLAAALAEPQRRRVSDDVAVTVVLDASRSIPLDEQAAVDAFIAEARARHGRKDDRLGVVTTGREAIVQSSPSLRVLGVDRAFVGDTSATNLAAGVRMAVAVAPQDAANRFLLASDGNETEGSLLAAADAARAAGIPIDVLPVQYRYPAEVILERVVAPANARGGETINLSIVATATAPVLGRLLITANGQPIDLNGDDEGLGAVRRLDAGRNVLNAQIQPLRPGPQAYTAVFEPVALLDDEGDPLATGQTGDAIEQNNRATAVTFVGAEGAVMLISDNPDEHGPMLKALEEAGVGAELVAPRDVPATLVELNRYDAVLILNRPAYDFSELQQQVLRQYVNDSGGGLVVVGGPESFGAGGWIGSPLEDALPVKLDVPQKRQMPRGALAIVVHSVEMPQGVYWGKEVCNAAIDALSRLDLVGIVEFQGLTGTDWVYPLQEKGDGAAAKRAVQRLNFGDMPSFDPSLNLALKDLGAVDAGQKHVIVISDGDPSLNRNILTEFRAAGITISAVGVFPHSPSDLSAMRRMAEATGGKYYDVTTNAALAELPEIIVKEAQTVRRTLIWEGDPFRPTVLGVPTETMRGITAVPPITGYVVTADREGLSLVTMRAVRTEEREGQEVRVDDPIAAQWQYGLGRVVAFTSDATARWSTAWTAWPAFKQFWEQHVRWAMRPAGSANLRVTTQTTGSTTEVIVDALDDRGERLNFADFRARAATPDGRGVDIAVTQIGPGRYRGTLEAADPGSYVISMTYRAPGAQPGAPQIQGSVQAAVTRPFADEFRALESNAALLRRVADTTGGRVLTRNPAESDLWSREGLDFPVALRPVWLVVALAGVGIFLADVGIRRVRLEPRALLASAVGLFRRSKAPARDAARAESLAAARDKARRRMAGADDPDTHRHAAARKFEAAPDAPAAAGPIALSGEAEAPRIEGLSRPQRQRAAQPDDETGMSRLMRAKRRAQDELQTDDDPKH